MFKVVEKSAKLSEEKAKTFYTFVMKVMFVCKRTRPDIQPAIAFLSTRPPYFRKNPEIRKIAIFGSISMFKFGQIGRAHV